MDTIPRLPMLFFELKAVEPHEVDFFSWIRPLVEKYGDSVESYANEIKELSSLRRSAVAVSSLSSNRDVQSCSILKRYYAQLHSIRNRFLMADCEDLMGMLTFKWVDTYTDNIIVGEINYEMLAILLNIGLVHMELGSVDSRSSDASCKMACTHFQCAAYAFEQVAEQSAGVLMSKDMAKDLLLFFTHISMAQAQECILEKSISDTRKPGIVAKVAAQVSEYYTSALMVLLQGSSDRSNTVQDIVDSRDFKTWKKYVEFKISYFSCMCNFFVGISSIEAEKLGQAIAWFAAADERLSEAAKHLKGMERQDWSALMMDGVKSVTEIIKKKTESAKKENDFIFHEPIPTADKLTAVKGASLVKGIPFSVSDPEVIGQDIFRRLVPIVAHEHASIYTDKKDNLIRDMSKKIVAKNEQLELFLSSLNLSTASLRPAPAQVPDELIEICAALSLRKDFLEEIEQRLMKLHELNSQVASEIKRISSIILKEKSDDKLYQNGSGSKPASSSIDSLEKEFEKLVEKHGKASESDSFLRNRFSKALPDLRMIVGSVQQLNKILPEPVAIPIDEENLKRLELLLKKVDEMKGQRTMLEKDIRDAVSSDDVLQKVLISGRNEVDDMFNKELKKFDEKLNLLELNLSAQDNIMDALTKANADYALTRKALMECELNRRTRTDEIIGSFEAVQNINDSAEKGIVFYNELLQSLRSLDPRLQVLQQRRREQKIQPPPSQRVHYQPPTPQSHPVYSVPQPQLPQPPQQFTPQLPQQFLPQPPQQFKQQLPQQFLPQQPQQFTPQPPQQFAPQPPQQFAPHPPQQFAPQPPPQFTPQPQLYSHNYPNYPAQHVVPSAARDLLTESVFETSDPNPTLFPTPITK